MQFRWAAAIALWTLLTGPIFTSLSGNGSRPVPAQAAVRTADSLGTVPSSPQR
ncbi:MAG TPA: hypothetical protein VEL76_34890 [Gemmataceae bacterium]|nr:hypothetical protein [Gemmataceae bacterium]